MDKKVCIQKHVLKNNSPLIQLYQQIFHTDCNKSGEKTYLIDLMEVRASNALLVAAVHVKMKLGNNTPE